MMVLGIDPGASGGWALLDRGKLYKWGRMPTVKLRSKTIVDGAALFGAIPCELDQAVVELVGAMPNQGSSSGFSFGHNTGTATAVAMIRCRETEWVTPQVWKKYWGLGRDKRDSLDLARTKFGAGPDWGVLANDGIAEAALMASWYLDVKHKIV